MFLYNSGIFLYFLAIRIASLFNRKARLLAEGQRTWKEELEKKLKAIEGQPRIWIHCASVGEFEQGRPVIEGIRRSYPDLRIILSFFSPSGYELHKNYELADVITYLPHDSKRNAAEFITRSKPSAVIFVKYEFWLNFLFALKERNIPTYLISAVIRKHQPFFKWFGAPFRQGLRAYKIIFVQDALSLQLLQSLGMSNGVQSGDTRFDRVLDIRAKGRELPEIKKFCDGKKVIVAGSTWPSDEAILIPAFARLKNEFPDLRLILTPHEVGRDHIHAIEKELKSAGLSYALYTSGDLKRQDVLVIDTVGILPLLYRYGILSYIGGGFLDGIHSILEPAVQGLPVFFGPKHEKFNEARDLLSSGGAKEVTDGENLYIALRNCLSDPSALQKASDACRAYVNANKGASADILARLEFTYNAGF